MSIGWKIVSALEEPLAEHSDLAFGHARSFWSEGYGLLSVARFLHHRSVYTQTTIQCKVDIHIDNKATTLQQHGPSLTIKHVKGHQDDNTPEDQLDLSA
eukprot:7133120-Ditylum_brightwellii.AAC.1